MYNRIIRNKFEFLKVELEIEIGYFEFGLGWIPVLGSENYIQGYGYPWG